jgi:hypothetical protein
MTSAHRFDTRRQILAAALDTDVSELVRIPCAHEREILETHLLTDITSSQRELISAAEPQVQATKAKLQDGPLPQT